MCGATARAPTLPSRRVWPSGAAWATKSVAILPPAPALFSTSTCCPMTSPTFFARMRATVSVPPPGWKPTTMVTGRLGYVPCPGAPPAQASAMTATRLLIMDLASFDSRPGFVDSPVLFSLEHRLPFLHERAPALDVVLAFEALLDKRRARPRVERGTRLQQLADDALRSADRQRRVLRDRGAVLEDERFQLRGWNDAVHEPHRFCFVGAELALGEEHLAGVGRADRVDEILQRRGAVAQAELRRGDAEPRVLRRKPQVAAERDIDARPEAVAADHGDHDLVAALEALDRASGDFLVIPDALGARALFLVLRDIRPRDESLVALAFEHDDADLRVLFEALKRLRHRLPHVDRDGVAPRRVVEGEPADRALLLDDEALGERSGRGSGLAGDRLQIFFGHGGVGSRNSGHCKRARRPAIAERRLSRTGAAAIRRAERVETTPESPEGLLGFHARFADHAREPPRVVAGEVGERHPWFKFPSSETPPSVRSRAKQIGVQEHQHEVQREAGEHLRPADLLEPDTGCGPGRSPRTGRWRWSRRTAASRRRPSCSCARPAAPSPISRGAAGLRRKSARRCPRAR